MSLINSLLNKFEAVEMSKNTSGRLTKFMEALGEKRDLGEFLGFLKTGKMYRVAVFTKVFLGLEFLSDKHLSVSSVLPLNSTSIPKASEFKMIKKQFTFKGKKFFDASQAKNNRELTDIIKTITQEIRREKDPVVEVKSSETPPDVSNQEKVKLVNTILEQMKNMPEGQFSEIQPAEDQNGRIEGGIRYWGGWEVPLDEEDDGDYDWEVLNTKSLRLLDTLKQSINNRLKNNRVSFSTEEKNWITVSIYKK